MQMLEFRVLNVLHGTQSLRGRLPLTPGSCLTWFGFSDEGQLSSYDSKVNVFELSCDSAHSKHFYACCLNALTSKYVFRVF